MPCYRLTFKNARVFEVVIEPAAVEVGLQQVGRVAVIYRIVDDVRDHAPLCRTNGEPITIYAANERAALEMSKGVLADAFTSTLDGVSECGARSMRPPLPNSN